MKCLYCAEEIRDEANVCRYCGRDLTLILSLKRENEQLRAEISAISAVENEDRELIDPTDNLQTQSEASSQTSPSPSSPSFLKRGTLSLSQCAWVVTLTAVAVVASVILDSELFFFRSTEEQATAALTDVFGLTEWHFAWSDILLLSCVASGYWVGARQPSRHLKTYFFLGTLTALVVTVTLASYIGIRSSGDIGSDVADIGLTFSGPMAMLLLGGQFHSYSFHVLSPLDYYQYSIIVTALFVSGALFGDLIVRIRHPHKAKVGLPERIAKRLPKSLSGRHVSNSIRAIPATLLLFTPLWQPIWGKVVETAYSAIQSSL